MTPDLPLSCQCGSFKATITSAPPSRANHVMCYCRDCQAAARHLGQFGTVTDELGGTTLYQTDPSRLRIDVGKEHLGLFRLSPKGLMRWYAKCCNTPLFNSVASPKISFIGVVTTTFDQPTDSFGPIRYRYKMDQALGTVEAPQGSTPAFIWKTVRNIVAARLSGRWKQTPLYDIETLDPVVAPVVISKEEKAAAYAAS